MKKIAIFLPDLRGGGAERVFLNLSKGFVARGYAVDMVLIRRQGELLDQLPSKVSVIDFDKSRIRSTFLPLLRYLRNAKPDALITVMWPLTIIGTLAFLVSGIKTKVVVSDHNTLSLSTADDTCIKRFLLSKTIKYVYPLANIRLAVSNGVAADVEQLSGLKQDTIKVIYNPIESPSYDLSVVRLAALESTNEVRTIISVGAFKAQKNQMVLIKAFAKVKARLNARLIILGDGVMRAELEQLVQQLGLDDSVSLPGFKKDIQAYYQTADVFVLSSNYEGFGNVIVEALAHGVPVVSTDCPSGPREILCDGKYGKLVAVGDVDALADAIVASLGQAHDPVRLIRRAADFSIERIASQYLELLFSER